MESATFCNGKYGFFNDFCYAEFLAYHMLENKSDKACEYQPDELDDSLFKNNHKVCCHHLVLLLLPFRDEVEFLSVFPPMYQNKLQEEGVQDFVNINKMKYEPYHDLVGQPFLQFNENLINNQDSHSQIENYETPGEEYPNESDSEKGETNKALALSNLIPQRLPDDEIAEGINSLNSKQRHYAKCDGHN